MDKYRMREFLWAIQVYVSRNSSDKEAREFLKRVNRYPLPHKDDFIKLPLDGVEKSEGLLKFLANRYAEKEEEEEDKASAAPNNFCEWEHQSEAYFAERMRKKFSSLLK
ncbi:hypothetical protein A9K97_gp318 [Tokyovirus A1]|uniref:hypothetical protein n=1 Tax=Tokyovirus A1 TaxID=1826170 RepID=UPI0007A98FF6|nr:hypothetical protein A9K97_gp318 [Tokyovirus A1]BAU80033.1 conserved hypothetical protein [Tokyovirus A1]